MTVELPKNLDNINEATKAVFGSDVRDAHHELNRENYDLAKNTRNSIIQLVGLNVGLHPDKFEEFQILKADYTAENDWEPDFKNAKSVKGSEAQDRFLRVFGNDDLIETIQSVDFNGDTISIGFDTYQYDVIVKPDSEFSEHFGLLQRTLAQCDDLAKACTKSQEYVTRRDAAFTAALEEVYGMFGERGIEMVHSIKDVIRDAVDYSYLNHGSKYSFSCVLGDMQRAGFTLGESAVVRDYLDLNFSGNKALSIHLEDIRNMEVKKIQQAMNDIDYDALFRDLDAGPLIGGESIDIPMPEPKKVSNVATFRPR
ncbi:TPA: hypothetical protein I7730_00740 [Vibrio vulnificus]|uniref:Uncharacterized protein n=1 Tax=Vibrio vulnificus TaxID=672 RepID=A0A8H9K5L7_VIBVL|nr:hypothetical protein [Vibrio vulnificus]HAS8538326.1 hypothetical protein [Vibrio vulnificus]